VKKTISLIQEYLDPKSLKKTEWEEVRTQNFRSSISTFKKQMKGLSFQILKELPFNEIVIEYSETLDEAMWAALRAAPIVEIVDHIVPKGV
jgi:hypothetical protein